MLNETTVLYFPDTESLADFLINNDVGNVLVDTRAYSITGEHSVALVQLACQHYGAVADSRLTISEENGEL